MRNATVKKVKLLLHKSAARGAHHLPPPPIRAKSSSKRCPLTRLIALPSPDSVWLVASVRLFQLFTRSFAHLLGLRRPNRLRLDVTIICTAAKSTAAGIATILRALIAAMVHKVELGIPTTLTQPKVQRPTVRTAILLVTVAVSTIAAM